MVLPAGTNERQVREDQRAALKFMVLSRKRPCVCLRELRSVFGDKTMSETQLWFWHKRFAQGDLSTPTKDRK